MTALQKNFYILNGREVSEKEIFLSILKRGFLHGDGVFETLKAENFRILRWGGHWERLRKGAGVCGIEIGEESVKLRKRIVTALKKNGLDRAYIRINAWRKATESFDPGDEQRAEILVLMKKYKPYPEKFYRDGIRCIISKTYFKNDKSPLTRIKSLNYLENILARTEAKKQGYDDSILLNTERYLASASVSNLFFVKGKKIFTPSVSCGILPGITRKDVLEICGRHGIKTEEGKFFQGDLKKADEVFLTNSLMGVMPVRAIKNIFTGKQFSCAVFLREELKNTN
ncbi:MAG: aminotransferase class IV family protein [Candidatus Omnitrophica bacterium]|nr:aminotransferase class IV family protein [Candidatus Omnitrophota bacterium]